MKKATTKRERKYGKKIEESKTKEPSEVKVMVDYYSIIKFKTLDAAKAFIDKKTKEAKESNRAPASYIIL